MEIKIKSYELGQGLYSILIRNQIASIVDPLKKPEFPIYSNNERNHLETEMVLFSSFSILYTLQYKLATEVYNKVFSGFCDLFHEDLWTDIEDKNKFRETFLFQRYSEYNQFFDKQFKDIAIAKTQDTFYLTEIATIFYKNALGRKPNNDELHFMTTVLIATYIATGKAVTNIIESYEIT